MVVVELLVLDQLFQVKILTMVSLITWLVILPIPNRLCFLFRLNLFWYSIGSRSYSLFHSRSHSFPLMDTHQWFMILWFELEWRSWIRLSLKIFTYLGSFSTMIEFNALSLLQYDFDFISMHGHKIILISSLFQQGEKLHITFLHGRPGWRHLCFFSKWAISRWLTKFLHTFFTLLHFFTQVG